MSSQNFGHRQWIERYSFHQNYIWTHTEFWRKQQKFKKNSNWFHTRLTQPGPIFFLWQWVAKLRLGARLLYPCLCEDWRRNPDAVLCPSPCLVFVTHTQFSFVSANSLRALAKQPLNWESHSNPGTEQLVWSRRLATESIGLSAESICGWKKNR